MGVHAATYAKSNADKANQFFRIAMRKAKNLLRDPPILVNPTADVFPLYSASMASEEQLIVHAAALVTTELLQLKRWIRSSTQSEGCAALVDRQKIRKLPA